MVKMRSAPAVARRFATSLAEIGSRPDVFFSCFAYAKYGITAVIRAAEARRSESMIRSSSMR
jgi:hypothetical protein